MERKEAIRSVYRLTGGIMTAFIHWGKELR